MRKSVVAHKGREPVISAFGANSVLSDYSNTPQRLNVVASSVIATTDEVCVRL